MSRLVPKIAAFGLNPASGNCPIIDTVIQQSAVVDGSSPVLVNSFNRGKYEEFFKDLQPNEVLLGLFEENVAHSNFMVSSREFT